LIPKFQRTIKYNYRYDWIDGASVTLMELVLGVVRTMSSNCLVMMRSGEESLYDLMPPEFGRIFREEDPQIREKVVAIKDIFKTLFGQTNQVQNYSCQFSGISI
jgi:hypothetical protein